MQQLKTQQLKAYLNTAGKAALDAGRIITRRAGRLHEIKTRDKGRNDPVSNVDIECEREIVGQLRRAFPDHAILSEESTDEGEDNAGGSTSGDTGASEWQWVIDPLDGTINFIHGFPHCAVSIALLHNGEPVVGAIFDPFKNELFLAGKGEGATLNQRKIRASTRAALADALIGTGFPYRDDQNLEDYLRTFRQIAGEAAGIRRAGAAALDLAYIACGRLDGFWEFGLRPWDIAAGIVIVREAGGLVGEPDGGEDCLKSGNVLAAGAALFKTMSQRLR